MAAKCDVCKSADVGTTAGGLVSCYVCGTHQPQEVSVDAPGENSNLPIESYGNVPVEAA